MLKLYKNYKDAQFRRPSAVAIGVFDGVHKGHRQIFEKTSEEARRLNARPAAVTFNFPQKKVLTTLPEKYELMQKFNIDTAVQLEGQGEWMNWSPSEFIDNFLLDRLNAYAVIVGRAFKFGKGRQGSAETLKGHGFKVEALDLLEYKGRRISSTLIKETILRGRVEEAAKMLGRPYFFTGRQIKGRGVGREMGFPTINFKVPPEKLLPEGVFEVDITLLSGQKRIKKSAACFIGPVRVKGIEKKESTVEVHVPNYRVASGQEPLKVEFKRFIRRPVKFSRREKLIRQIKKDLESIRQNS